MTIPDVIPPSYFDLYHVYRLVLPIKLMIVTFRINADIYSVLYLAMIG